MYVPGRGVRGVGVTADGATRHSSLCPAVEGRQSEQRDERRTFQTKALWSIQLVLNASIDAAILRSHPVGRTIMKDEPQHQRRL